MRRILASVAALGVLSVPALCQEMRPVNIWLQLPEVLDAGVVAKEGRTQRDAAALLGPRMIREVLVPTPGHGPVIRFHSPGWVPSLDPLERHALLASLESSWGKDIRIEEEGSSLGALALSDFAAPLRDAPHGTFDPSRFLGSLPASLFAGDFAKAYDGLSAPQDHMGGPSGSAFGTFQPRQPPDAWRLAPPAAQIVIAAPPQAPAKPVGPYEAEIQAAAKEKGVDAEVLRAVVAAKSGFNAKQVSGGAYGLMGLSPYTLKALGYSRANILDPETNLRAGAEVLASLLRQFDGDVHRALAAYQDGPAAVLRSGGIPNDGNVKDFIAAYEKAYRGDGPAKPPVVAVKPPKANNVRRQVKDAVQDRWAQLDARCRRSRSMTCWEPLIKDVAAKVGLDENATRLYEAMLQQENPQGDPTAVSPAGAIGLAQLMPDTAALLKVKDPENPRQNLTGGARHLKSMLQEYHGDQVLAAAAYNAGDGNVKTHVPRFAETMGYVRAVFRNYLGLGGEAVDVESYIPPPPPPRRRIARAVPGPRLAKNVDKDAP